MNSLHDMHDVPVDPHSKTPVIGSSIPQARQIYKSESQETVITEKSKQVLGKNPVEQLPKLGPVTVLIGPSSVGKSSMIAELRKLMPDLEESGPDLAGFQTVLAWLENQQHVSKEDYSFLKSTLKSKNNDIQILDAISGGVFSFKENVSIEDQERAKKIASILKKPTDTFAEKMGEDLEKIMLDKVLIFSEQGKPAIFDTMFVDNVFKHTINKTPIKTALIYCPFHELTVRLAKRTEKALKENELSEVRIGPRPLMQFAEIFGPKTRETDVVVDTVTREMVKNDFDTNFDAWLKLEEIPRLDKLSAEKKEKRLQELEVERRDNKEKLLEALGFVDPSIKQVEITPRCPGRYDTLIDTSKSSPAQSAAKIKKLHER